MYLYQFPPESTSRYLANHLHLILMCAISVGLNYIVIFLVFDCWCPFIRGALSCKLVCNFLFDQQSYPLKMNLMFQSLYKAQKLWLRMISHLGKIITMWRVCNAMCTWIRSSSNPTYFEYAEDQYSSSRFPL